MHHLIADHGKRAILGFACDVGVRRNQGRPGAHEGPNALRTALANLAAPPDAQAIVDCGDVAALGDALEEAQDALSTRITTALAAHERVIVFGGGHETAFASYRGLRANVPDARIGILNLDAHLDIRAIGPSGATSGTPFAQIHDWDPSRFDYLCAGIAREANTQALITRAEAWDVGMVEDRALIENPSSADAAIDALIGRNDVLYLTICLDVFAHFQAPGVSAPAARGVPFPTIERIVSRCLQAAARGDIALPLADIVELSPPHDRAGMTARTAAFLARALLCD
jgi:formiminoglutamase